MGQFAQQIVRVAGPSMWIAQQMLKDVKPETFARKPAIGGKVVDANHPAFVYGHLATYPSGALQMLGLDPKPAAVPPAYAELFSAGKECRDDPSGVIYPPMKEITDHFFRAYGALVEALKTIPDEKLYEPNPREGRMKEMFPEIGGMMMFLLASHPMMHLGQVSTWRRCFGLGSAM
jgi:hypothetical protein